MIFGNASDDGIDHETTGQGDHHKQRKNRHRQRARHGNLGRRGARNRPAGVAANKPDIGQAACDTDNAGQEKSAAPG